jgi:hypothetical protein
MSYRLQNAVCDNADNGFYESATQFAVMRALVSFADDDGTSCFPSHQTVAKRSRRSRDTVIRILKEFIEKGWIKVIAHQMGGRQNSYRILPHGCVNPKGKVAKAAKETCSNVRQHVSDDATAPVGSYDSSCRMVRHNSYQQSNQPFKSVESISSVGFPTERSTANGDVENSDREEAGALEVRSIPTGVRGLNQIVFQSPSSETQDSAGHAPPAKAPDPFYVRAVLCANLRSVPWSELVRWLQKRTNQELTDFSNDRKAAGDEDLNWFQRQARAILERRQSDTPQVRKHAHKGSRGLCRRTHRRRRR